jgi:hypothetical protein
MGRHVGDQPVDIEQAHPVNACQAVEEGAPQGSRDAGQQPRARRAQAASEGREPQVGGVPHHESACPFSLQLTQHGDDVIEVICRTRRNGGGGIGPGQHLQGNVAHIVATARDHVEGIGRRPAGAGDEAIHLVTQGRHVIHATRVGAPVGKTGAPRQGGQQGACSQLLGKHLRPHRPVAVAPGAVGVERDEVVAADGRVRRDARAEDQGQGNGVVAHVRKAVAEHVELRVGRRGGRAGRQAEPEHRVPEKAGDFHRCLLLGWEGAFAWGEYAD